MNPVHSFSFLALIPLFTPPALFPLNNSFFISRHDCFLKSFLPNLSLVISLKVYASLSFSSPSFPDWYPLMCCSHILFDSLGPLSFLSTHLSLFFGPLYCLSSSSYISTSSLFFLFICCLSPSGIHFFLTFFHSLFLSFLHSSIFMLH